MADYPYNVLDHTADFAIIARGPCPEAVFERCGYALFDYMVDLRAVRSHEAFVVEMGAPADPTTLGEILIAWLNELLFRFESAGEVFREFEVSLLAEGAVRSTHRGEYFNPSRHPCGAEIKAATYHGLKVTRYDGAWEGRVIFDV